MNMNPNPYHPPSTKSEANPERPQGANPDLGRRSLLVVLIGAAIYVVLFGAAVCLSVLSDSKSVLHEIIWCVRAAAGVAIVTFFTSLAMAIAQLFKDGASQRPWRYEFLTIGLNVFLLLPAIGWAVMNLLAFEFAPAVGAN
jgi:hypothetical protein